MSACRLWRFWPIMSSGMRKIWIMLLMNSHSTNAGYGSKRRAAGPSVFQPSQHTVHAKMMRKNPIVPTWSVIQMATRSRAVNC
jgi:hypothetical protein